jgi:tetratricopeptide (TPR) repeat protein
MRDRRSRAAWRPPASRSGPTVCATTGAETGVSDTSDTRSRRAEALHQSGRVGEAIGLYQEILRDDPDHAETLHLLGVALAQTGRSEDGARLMARSIEVRPDSPAVLMNLGNAMRDLGHLEDALSCYARVTTLRPEFVGGFRARGKTLVALGRAEEALAYLGQAVRLAPNDADANSELGVALDAAGRKQTALQCFDRAIAFNPAHGHAHHNRAILLAESGRHAEALESYDRAAALQPRNASMHSNRGEVLRSLGRHAEALAAFDAALELAPAHPTAWYNRGLVLILLGQRAEALRSLDRAIEVRPDDAAGHFLRGETLTALGRPAESLPSYESALALAPDDFRSRLHRGQALFLLGRFAEAIEDFDRAAELDPGAWEVFNNRGVALDRLSRETEALESFVRAITLKSDSAKAHTNAGNVLKALRRYPEAALSFERALAAEPDDPVAQWSKAHLKLALGEFRAGWPLYEARFRVELLDTPPRAFAAPRWRGSETLEGRTLLVHAEQGLGDTIQFCRYMRVLEARGAAVVLEVQPALKRLLGTLAFNGRLIGRGETIGPMDFETPLLSLPGALGTTLETIPQEVPYLGAERERVDFWAARLAGLAPLKVGIAWQGNVEAERRVSSRPRSAPLASFAALARLPGVSLVSLQKGPGEEQLASVDFGAQVTSFGAELDVGIDAFIDTAALIASLDLVVTSDTSIAHLAGALGRPVWVVLSEVPDSRWLLDRADSPWYPTMRLFRMPLGGGWRELLDSVAAALALGVPPRRVTRVPDTAPGLVRTAGGRLSD